MAVVVLIGGMLTREYLAHDAIWFVPLLFVVIRRLAVLLGLLGSRVTGMQRTMICWFGIRGVGSLYYLTYAIQHGVGGEGAQRLTALALTTAAASIALHGVSVTPPMNTYGNRSERRRAEGWRGTLTTGLGTCGQKREYATFVGSAS